MPTSARDQRDGEGTTVQSRSRMAITVTKLPTVPDGRARRQAVDAAARTIPRQGDWQAMAARMLRLAQDAALLGRMALRAGPRGHKLQHAGTYRVAVGMSSLRPTGLISVQSRFTGTKSRTQLHPRSRSAIWRWLTIR
jgi:hypothetical protein